MTYKQINDPFNGEVSTSLILGIDGEVTLYIPVDSRNADYQKYEAWVAAGNVIAGP